jgi:class 3 adenylate cyclase
LSAPSLTSVRSSSSGSLVGLSEAEVARRHTLNAVRAALECSSAVNEWNEERAEHGDPPVGVGFGINTGPTSAGFLGVETRQEYTMIGETVLTANKICGVAEPGQVLISERTYELIRDQPEFEPRDMGVRPLKGGGEMRLFEVLFGPGHRQVARASSPRSRSHPV